MFTLVYWNVLTNIRRIFEEKNISSLSGRIYSGRMHLCLYTRNLKGGGNREIHP